MKVNQKYIAEKLNVSRVTVTKALLDHPDISIQTREKVKKLADKLGYIPNKVGRNLSTQKTGTIGIIIPKIDHSFFSQATESMYAKAAVLGYQIILMISFEDEHIERKNIKTLISMNVDGIIIDTCTNDRKTDGFKLIKQYNIPFLFFDRKLSEDDVAGVFFDDYDLSKELTRQVLKLGYKKIGYISGPANINISQDRLNGFLEILKEYKLTLPHKWLLKSDFTELSGYNTLVKFLQKNETMPEVVFCVNDSVALGIYKACSEYKIKIPEDLSVVGFGNLYVSKLVNPPLSTVSLPVEKAGEIVIEKLVKIIDDKVAPNTTRLPGHVLLRGSTINKSN